MKRDFFKSFSLVDNKLRPTRLGWVLLLLLPFLAPLADGPADPDNPAPPRKRLFESEASYRQRVDQFERQEFLNDLPAEQRAAAEARQTELEEILNRHIQSHRQRIDD